VCGASVASKKVKSHASQKDETMHFSFLLLKLHINRFAISNSNIYSHAIGDALVELEYCIEFWHLYVRTKTICLKNNDESANSFDSNGINVF
jgi:hypothetical protein